MAQLGERIFYDASLSASGKHVLRLLPRPGACLRPGGRGTGGARRAEAGPAGRAGGAVADVSASASRHSASGPDNEENETVTLAQMVALTRGVPRAQKTANDTAQSAANAGAAGRAVLGRAGRHAAAAGDRAAAQPAGDGRRQRRGGGGEAARRPPMRRISCSCSARRSWTGPTCWWPRRMFAVARYQIEDPSFHPYTSKFDFWLEGRARLTPAELRGYVLFNDPSRADCAGCHLDKATRGRIAAAIHRRPVRGAGRTAQHEAAGQRRPGVLRPGHLRPDTAPT